MYWLSPLSTGHCVDCRHGASSASVQSLTPQSLHARLKMSSAVSGPAVPGRPGRPAGGSGGIRPRRQRMADALAQELAVSVVAGGVPIDRRSLDGVADTHLHRAAVPGVGAQRPSRRHHHVAGAHRHVHLAGGRPQGRVFDVGGGSHFIRLVRVPRQVVRGLRRQRSTPLRLKGESRYEVCGSRLLPVAGSLTISWATAIEATPRAIAADAATNIHDRQRYRRRATGRRQNRCSWALVRGRRGGTGNAGGCRRQRGGSVRLQPRR